MGKGVPRLCESVRRVVCVGVYVSARERERAFVCLCAGFSVGRRLCKRVCSYVSVDVSACVCMYVGANVVV